MDGIIDGQFPDDNTADRVPTSDDVTVNGGEMPSLPPITSR